MQKAPSWCDVGHENIMKTCTVTHVKDGTYNSVDDLVRDTALMQEDEEAHTGRKEREEIRFARIRRS